VAARALGLIGAQGGEKFTLARTGGYLDPGRGAGLSADAAPDNGAAAILSHIVVAIPAGSSDWRQAELVAVAWSWRFLARAQRDFNPGGDTAGAAISAFDHLAAARLGGHAMA
jgi:hypothetical protein